MKFVETFGKTREEAVEKAARELGVSKEDLIVEILEEGNKGFLGLIGAKDFKIKASIKESAQIDFSPKDILFGVEEEKKSEDKSMKEEKFVSTEESEKSSAPVISDEQIKESVDQFLGDVFKSLQIEAKTSIHREGDIVKVMIEGENAGVLIGRRGEALDSLQLLLGLAVNKTAEGYVKLQLDIENYREKREESLVRYAHKMARMASKQRRNIRLEPMSPNERRIVHSALQSDSYVTTYSEGDEPYRKVVIAVRGRHQSKEQ